MKEIVIGFLGCGNVGYGVWRLLEDMKTELAQRHDLSVRVKRVLVRNVERYLDKVPAEVLTDDPDVLLNDPEISLVTEFLGGDHPAFEYQLAALNNGKTVVTANKLALALNWPALQEAANRTGAGLYYEASVCGAIPIINALNNPLQANRISGLMGIINGTTNYILSRMTANGEDFGPVLADAQHLGLAEPNPTADIDGYDAAYKLSIMASLAFNTHVPYEKIYREGIRQVSAADITAAAEMGYVIKLLAIGKRSGKTIETRVHPTFLPKDHPLAQVNGSFNAVYLTGHACQEMMFQGRGAGDMPTASAIVGDIITAAKANVHYPPTFEVTEKADSMLNFTNNWTTRYYVRIAAVDEPGVLAEVAGCLASEGVSIATMMQKGMTPDGRVPLIMITHEAAEQSMRAALCRLNPARCRTESMIRVEGV